MASKKDPRAVTACPSDLCREIAYRDHELFCTACNTTFTKIDIEYDDDMVETMEGLRKMYPGWTDDQIICKSLRTAMGDIPKAPSAESHQETQAQE